MELGQRSRGLLTCNCRSVCTQLPDPPGLMPDAIIIVIKEAANLLMGVISGIRWALAMTPIPPLSPSSFGAAK